MKDRLESVVLQRLRGYMQGEVAAFVDTVIQQLGIESSLYNKTVLLKPNFISSSGPFHSCTHPDFVAGVGRWFIDQGARVVVGDSPAVGSCQKVCEKQGVIEATKGLGVEFVEFKTVVMHKLQDNTEVAVAQEALECDLFVGLPKVKAHNQFCVTLAAKNLFGIVKGINKAKYHMTRGGDPLRFAKMIVNLTDILPQQLHLVDGIEAMSGSGPLDGASLPVNCIAGGRSPVVLETALVNLLEVDETRSLIWQAAKDQARFGTALQDLSFPLLQPADFHGSGFLAPEILNPVRFSAIRFINGLFKRACLKFSGQGGLS